MAERIALALINGIVSEIPSGDTIRGAGLSSLGDKFKYHLASLAADDKVTAINYLDFGTRTQRISSVQLTSVQKPDCNVIATISYLDLGTIKQRIDKVDVSGSVFGTDILRKVFNYELVATRYKLLGFEFQII